MPKKNRPPRRHTDRWLRFARWVLSDRARTRRVVLLLDTVLTAALIVVWLLAPQVDAVADLVTHLLRASSR